MKISGSTVIILTAFCGLLGLNGCTEAQPSIKAPVDWQTHLRPASVPANFKPAISESIYVPVYSHIYHENDTQTTLLASTLSIRNTDAKHDLILKSVAYYSTDGKLLRELCQQPLILGPMATADIVVPRTNTEGGSGANFVIQLMSKDKITEPIAEAVMISLGSAQSISFVSRGQVISHTSGEPGTSPATKPKAQVISPTTEEPGTAPATKPKAQKPSAAKKD